jgi:hypothetical protein
MIIAALAVIMVSLVGIASMTGILPRVGDARPNTEAIPDKPVNERVQPDESQPAEKQLPLRALPARYPSALAVCSGPAASASTVAVVPDFRTARLRVACDAA